jgi:hypothetical protein
MAREAKAINLPDTGSCSSSSQCLSIANTFSSGVAIYASNSSTTGGGGIWGAGGAYGVYGTASSSVGGAGVFGQQSSGVGVQGVSGNNTGVPSGTNAGVFGVSTIGMGVYGSGQTDGVQGSTSSSGNAGVSGVNSATSGNAYGVYGQTSSSSGYAGYFVGNVYATGTITPGSSDIRLKKNVESLGAALDTLLQLHGVTFEWKDPSDFAGQTGTQRGFIAQEVEKVMPEWIRSDSRGFKTISIPGRALEAMLVESLRQLKSENDALRAQQLKLDERIKALESNRRPLAAGFGEGAMGLAGLGAAAGAVVVSRRRRSGS